ncbi:citrate/tricarballylate utilization protein [Roseiarcus fermentans]|uniref:Citrate/tricarballylate utilization protein n=1 Tax=Roseiarcus fermentans TaxID=1473586 RepID=A0A366EKA9_9HYPH|nr:tricarballylate utilization 4Fe-4S protein TcuB [Roseiarcus fermentans]RBP02862.1 citrate/tricarballylate utilization protein [Roseiarcus fermentans]
MPPDSAASEAERVLRICSACMYCDGLCPVFPALAGRHAYPANDLNYLANLCHNCRGCWYACQYAPPHPFAVNLPTALAALRRESYAETVWPRLLGRAFRRPALGAVLIVAAALAAMIAIVAASGSPAALWRVRAGPGSFYAAVPWSVMAGLAGVSIAWAIVSMAASTWRFWRAIAPKVPGRALWLAAGPALRDIVTLRHLGGGGPGCNDEDIRFSKRRRLFHHLMAGGVALDVAATLAAAACQDVFSWPPPYPLASLPVGLGAVGGVGVVVGAAGLLALEARADRAPSERGESVLNVAFLVALEVVALSGFALFALRDTAVMGPLLVVHIGTVVGLFVGLPAMKSLHAPFRAAALLRAAAEQKASEGKEGARAARVLSE